MACLKGELATSPAAYIPGTLVSDLRLIIISPLLFLSTPIRFAKVELGLEPKYHFTGGDHGWVGDVPQVVLSIDKALSTGWKPKLKCEEAIRRTVRELI